MKDVDGCYVENNRGVSRHSQNPGDVSITARGTVEAPSEPLGENVHMNGGTKRWMLVESDSLEALNSSARQNHCHYDDNRDNRLSGNLSVSYRCGRTPLPATVPCRKEY